MSSSSIVALLPGGINASCWVLGEGEAAPPPFVDASSLLLMKKKLPELKRFPVLLPSLLLFW